jgi:hypothetical protein
MHPFTIVLLIAAIANGLNIWYMIRSRRLHNLCIKRRKENKNK